MNIAYSPLEAAALIGHRLSAQAEWARDQCTWIVVGVDRDDPWSRRPTFEAAGPSIYKGTAGIGLFLSELGRVTGDAAILRCADGAFNNAIEAAHAMRAAELSFHSGRAGVAWALLRHSQIEGRERYRDDARKILATIWGHENQSVCDLIGGAAGTIPALLSMRGEVDESIVLESALRLGVHLRESAKPNPVGWSWGSSSALNARDLTGFAHGAAGCGLALFELHAALGVDWALYLGEQAFVYENQFFDSTTKNWPDFRHAMIGGAFRIPRRTAELRERLLGGEPFPYYQTHFMKAWCHGAPGIALSRIRAYELTRCETFRDEGYLAIDSTVEGFRDVAAANYSLCHGICGNVESLLEGAATFRNLEWETLAMSVVMQGVERFENNSKPWPSGALDARPDPSLFLGDAGIGYSLLRLHTKSVPSVLLLRGSGAGDQGTCLAPSREFPTRADICSAQRRSFFEESILALEILSRRGDELATNVLQASAEDDAKRFCSRLSSLVECGESTLRSSQIQNLLAIDIEAFRATEQIDDFLEPRIRELGRPTSANVAWSTARFTLTKGTRLIRYSAPTIDARHRVEGPSDDCPVRVLLWQSHGLIARRSVGPLAGRILERLAKPADLIDILRLFVGEIPEHDEAQRNQIEELIIAQLKDAYEAGIIQTVPRDQISSNASHSAGVA